MRQHTTMPLPALVSYPRVQLGDEDRPALSAALLSCALSQRSSRAAWLADIELLAVRPAPRWRPKRRTRAIQTVDFETGVEGTKPVPEPADPDPDWLEGRMVPVGGACSMFLGEALLFKGKVVSVSMHLRQAGGPMVRLSCKGVAPGALRPEAVLTLRHGSNLRQAEISFATAFPKQVSVQGTANGIGQLRPGGGIELAGLGSAFGGSFRLGAVTWRWSTEDGPSSHFAARRLKPPVG